MNLKEPDSEAFWGREETRMKRELQVAGDPETRAEALRLLESQPIISVVRPGRAVSAGCISGDRKPDPGHRR